MKTAGPERPNRLRGRARASILIIVVLILVGAGVGAWRFYKHEHQPRKPLYKVEILETPPPDVKLKDPTYRLPST